MNAIVDKPRFGPSAFEHQLHNRPRRRWMGWRLRFLVVAALIGCLALFTLMNMLASTTQVAASWEIEPRDQLRLQDSPDPALQSHIGAVLVSVSSAHYERMPINAALLRKSPRWIVDDDARAAHARAVAALNAVFRDGAVTLHFADGSAAEVTLGTRGYAGVPLLFWLLGAFALLLYTVGAVLVAAQPQMRNILFALFSTCQAMALLWLAVDALEPLGSSPPLPLDSLPWRAVLDVVTMSAMVHAFMLQPRRLKAHTAVGTAAWCAAAAFAWAAFNGRLPGLWWWTAAMSLALGMTALAILSYSYRLEPNPFAAVMRRFGLAAALTHVLALSSVVLSARGTVPYAVAEAAAVVWTVFFASLMVLVPFLSRARQVLREFAMLAGLSTVATSLDLLFVSVFSFGKFTSLTLAVFIALAAYAAARQWVLTRMLGTTLVTTERTFEHLYRVAREVQLHPARYPQLLAQLMRDLFDPLELVRLQRSEPRARVAADGAAMIVPLVEPSSATGSPSTSSLMLRFAGGGRRLFTQDDARLTDRVVEQLRRAVAYDEAVERGRTEERLRIAQDLHDDIGARLLTLMYQAQSKEIEDYVRHTLQDLKTLTRGLAASEHRLSHAAAEWKSDVQQRLTAAHIELVWSFTFDHDMILGVVQWSALTRVLRELVSNTIYHAKAGRVNVVAVLERGAFSLTVSDDGVGREPQKWSPGLGLGGVRKRLKLLGGSVVWRENGERGIVCAVHVPVLTGAPDG